MNTGYKIMAAVLAAASVILAVAAVILFRPGFDVSDYRPEPAPIYEPEIKPRKNVPGEPYVSPVDFEKLRKINGEIYAWLDIPNTDISYPVVQSSEDDTKYVRHDIRGNYATAGTLFTEHEYNGTSFDDPVTVIYGHRMRSREMFGQLELIYSVEETFYQNKEIIVYLPDRELRYEVFAAVPFGRNHIMFTFDSFKEEGSLEFFVSEIYKIRGFNINTDPSVNVTGNDKVLVLSTCLQGNRSKRYLVLARRTDVIT